MSYARMVEAEPKLAAEVAAWLKAAGQADQAEDGALGAKRRSDEMLDWAVSKERRLAKIRAAKAALEAEAQVIVAQTVSDRACGFRQFLRRGLAAVRHEWSLICTVHNLLKLAAARRKLQPIMVNTA